MKTRGARRTLQIVALLLVVVLGTGGTGWGAGGHSRTAGVLAMDLAGADPALALAGRPSGDAIPSTTVYFPLMMHNWPPIPAAPHLDPIVNPNEQSSYLVLWSSSFLATYYVLEEATHSDFSNVQEVFAGLALLYSATGKAPGDYYYRVKAVHVTTTASYSSPWSNVVSTHVGVTYAFQDDFCRSSSGWPHQVFTLDDHPVLSAYYSSCAYYMRIVVDTGFALEHMGIVPSPYEHFDDTYDVEVDQVFLPASDVEPAFAKASLVFRGDIGASGYFTSVYAIEWNFEGNCAVSAYNGSYMDSFIPGDAVPNPIYQGWVHCPSITPGYDHNVHALAEVRGDEVTIYLNDALIGTFSPIGGRSQMGLITGSWVSVPVESRFDNFRVIDR
jgi:hypothetical protein